MKRCAAPEVERASPARLALGVATCRRPPRQPPAALPLPSSLQVQDLGEGASGVVKLMRDGRTGELVAVKLMRRGDTVRRAGHRKDAAAGHGSCPRYPAPCLRAERPAARPCPPQIHASTHEAILLYSRLTGHENVVQFFEVGASAGAGGRPAAGRPTPAAFGADLPSTPATLRAACGGTLACLAALPTTAPSHVHPTQVFLAPSHLGLVMEFAPGGTLFDLVAARMRLREGEARHFFRQLVAALAWCHAQVRRRRRRCRPAGGLAAVGCSPP